MKYAIVTFGCRVNQADSLALEERLLARGASSSHPDAADLIIVNSCSVTASADQGTRQTIRRLARNNPQAQVVVTGCYASREPEHIRQLPNVFQVVPNSQKDDLIQLLDSAGLTTASRFGDGDGSCGATVVPGVAGRTAFTLRVQTGCSEPCAYCIIPTTRGLPRSVSVSGVVRDVERAFAAGFKEIVLTGVHLGSYGRDLSPQQSLLELLGPLSIQFSDALFRISSLEPMDCTDDIVDLVATSGCFAHHFHLPLQHASDRILATMQRPYTIERYERLAARIRRQMPDAAIGSDVIVGFPGETDEDFAQLTSYLASSPLTHLHVFPYSDRPGTVASGLSEKVPGAVVRERAREIRSISEQLALRFRESQIGKIHKALTLDDGTLAATGNYLKLRIAGGLERNRWVQIRVLSHHAGEVLGRGGLSLEDELTAGGADVAAAALTH